MTSTHTDSSSAQSAPPSPATTMSQDYPAVDNNDNSLDDIFGSSPPHESTLTAPLPSTINPYTQSTEPSDLPSLRRQHVTAGYRDGTSASKGAHVQEGFDGGFPVGAQLGMRAGTVLGIMEGLLRGFEERSGPGVVRKPVVRAGHSAVSTGTDGGNTEIGELRKQKREQLRTLYEAAVKELDVQAVFAGADGGAAEVAPRAEDGEEERAEKQLGRKGDVVISKWEGRVDVPRWEENMEALEMKEKEKEESKSKGKGEGEAQGQGQAVEHS